MAETLTLNVTRAATAAPAIYRVPGSTELEALTAFAAFDGTAASGPWLACMAFYSDAGLLLARVFPEGALAVGDTAEVTFATSLSSSVSIDQPATGFKLISAATTNATLVQAGPSRLSSYYLSNQNAAVRYVKFYNKATQPTVGTDVPLWTLAIPAGSAANLELDSPLEFPLGLGIATTTGVADSDVGAVAANDIVVNLGIV